MRLGLISQEYPPETAHGGIATQTFLKAHGLAALGHEVYVISQSVDGERHERSDGGVTVIRIPGYDKQIQIDTDIVRWLTRSFLVAEEIAALQKRCPLDVLDFAEWGCEAYVHLLNRAPWSEKVPTTIHLQGPLVMLANTIGWPEKDSELYKTGLVMEETCLRLADGIASSSECSARWIRTHYSVRDDPIPVIHAGVDHTLFRPGLATPDERPTIVFAGRVAFSKGVDTLVDAACILADEFGDLRVRLIGRADDAVRADLSARAEAARRPRLLEFPGPVGRGELPHELCRAHVFAAPSRYEGGPGFVYLEAMACGIPVVACSGSGVAEIIRDGETGMLVPPGDCAALAETLRKLLADRAYRERIALAGRAYAVSEADTAACVKRYEKFLATVVRGRQ